MGRQEKVDQLHIPGIGGAIESKRTNGTDRDGDSSRSFTVLAIPTSRNSAGSQGRKAGDAKIQYWRDRYQRIKAEKEAMLPPDSLEELKDLEIAYIAGLIDGEGCISIVFTSRKLYMPSVQVIMTGQPVLEWLANRLNVKCSKLNRKLAEHHKTQYEVRLNGRRAVWLCMLMEPYLKEKHRQAQIVIEFGETYQTGYDSRSISSDTFDKRQQLKERMHQLNKRGI